MARRTSIRVGTPLLFVLLAVPILFLALVGGQASRPHTTCATTPDFLPASTSDEELDAEQMSVATQVVAAVRAFEPTSEKPHAAVVALATARQESGIRNLDYGDRDSLGVFQQRPSQGWGTPEQVMNIAHATTSFLEQLIVVPGWETRPVTDVAADVQLPAEENRGLYEQWVPLATRLTENLWPNVQISQIGSAATASCDQVVLAAGGPVVYPVPPAFIGTDQHNWGATGGYWSSWHTGTDFSVPCGTPVLAATAGTVEIDTSESWAGHWLVKVVTGPGSLATWYAHMQTLTVSAGQTVTPGQQIGEAGDEGNASGCHLHFEVHTKGGPIYGPDNVDPSNWLAENVGKSIGGTFVGGSRSFVIATFNALGDSHTRPGGNKPGWADSATRTRWLAELLATQGPDVVGLQEFQGPQARVFGEITGDTWDSFGNKDNVIVWRRATFQLVSTDTVDIPYFGGSTRQMPLVRLKHLSTGHVVTVLDVHNPADARGPAAQWRAEAITRERTVIARERAAGLPVFLVGDLNDRAEAFCPLTAGGLVISASGGSNGGADGCQPPPDMNIDWILGTGAVFSGYIVDETPKGRVSDHPYVEAVATVDAAAF